MSDPRQQLETIKNDGLAEIAAAIDLSALDTARVKYLGRKGAVRAAFDLLPTLPKEERPAVGALANQVNQALTAALEERKLALEATSRQIGRAHV
jgi:phenylalanyl-tRNA synthetase alpha chain